MRRRVFLSSVACVGAWPLVARAQRRHGWSPDGPLDGREPADPHDMTAEEQRHVPVLTMPERVHAGRPFDLVVQVGVRPHGMVENHRVEWVEVAVDAERVLVADLGPSVAYPVVRVPIVMAASAELTARAHCNLHGTWRTRRRIEVVG